MWDVGCGVPSAGLLKLREGTTALGSRQYDPMNTNKSHVHSGPFDPLSPASLLPHFLNLMSVLYAPQSTVTVLLLHSRANTPVPSPVSAQSPSGVP